jgi:hypothetical protein
LRRLKRCASAGLKKRGASSTSHWGSMVMTLFWFWYWLWLF